MKSTCYCSGDIAFPLSQRKKPKDDDTENPIEPMEEEFKEDLPEDPPNSQTYMYNEKDVRYIASRLLEDFKRVAHFLMQPK